MGGALATRALPLAVAFALVAALAACGGGNDRIARTGTGPVHVKRDGRLDADPAPLTLADVAREKRGSAQAAVLELFFWSQWGSVPNVVAAYDASVRRGLTTARIASAYASQRQFLLGARPRIAGVTRSRLGTFVAVNFYSRLAPPAHHSFLLARRGGTWQVLYDTFLESCLAQQAAGAITQQWRRPPRAIRVRANRAAAAAASQYQDVFLASSGAQGVAGFRRQSALGR